MNQLLTSNIIANKEENFNLLENNQEQFENQEKMVEESIQLGDQQINMLLVQNITDSMNCIV